jgi:hypothetical protein
VSAASEYGSSNAAPREPSAPSETTLIVLTVKTIIERADRWPFLQQTRPRSAPAIDAL